MTEPLALVFVGIVVGFFGTIVGAGGGFLVIPYLLLVCGMSPQLAIGTSLTMVFLNAVSGTVAFIQQKRVDLETGIKFALATVPGAIVGSYITVYFTSQLFSILFGLLLIVLAGSLFFRSIKQRTKQDSQNQAKTAIELVPGKFEKIRIFTQNSGEVVAYSFNEALGIVISFAVGFLSSVFGIGGGIIHVPLMILILNFPPHVATATSFFILTISTLIGFVTHFLLGHVDLSRALWLAFGAITGGQLGARVSQRVDGRLIALMLAIALIFVGIRLMLL